MVRGRKDIAVGQDSINCFIVVVLTNVNRVFTVIKLVSEMIKVKHLILLLL